MTWIVSLVDLLDFCLGIVAKPLFEGKTVHFAFAIQGIPNHKDKRWSLELLVGGQVVFWT